MIKPTVSVEGAETIGNALRNFVCARGTTAGAHSSIVDACAVGISKSIQIDTHAYFVLAIS